MVPESFSSYIKRRREELRRSSPAYSQRQVALRIGIEPSYLSKLERGEQMHLSEEKIRAIAGVLDIDPDVLLAMCGKISRDLQQVICKRPQLFAALIRELKELPDHAVLRIAREVRDGNW